MKLGDSVSRGLNPGLLYMNSGSHILERCEQARGEPETAVRV